jgi:CRP/FNR family transcriptional regulator, cyclic AMP receptor protein
MTAPALDFGFLTRIGFPLRSYAAGDKVFVRDEDGDAMYVVRSGRVNILALGTVVESIGPNGIFGEMALLDGSPRSATAVAAERSELAPIDKKAFLHLVQQNPDFALQIMRLLVARLRQMNEGL